MSIITRFLQAPRQLRDVSFILLRCAKLVVFCVCLFFSFKVTTCLWVQSRKQPLLLKPDSWATPRMPEKHSVSASGTTCLEAPLVRAASPPHCLEEKKKTPKPRSLILSCQSHLPLFSLVTLLDTTGDSQHPAALPVWFYSCYTIIITDLLEQCEAQCDFYVLKQ